MYAKGISPLIDWAPFLLWVCTCTCTCIYTSFLFLHLTGHTSFLHWLAAAMPQYEYVYKYSLPLYESHSSTRTTCSCSLGSKVLSFLHLYHNTDTPRPFPLVYHPCSPRSKNGDFPICAVPGNSRCSMGQRLLVLLAGT